MTWDPLDGELVGKLDKRKYVSLSRDRARQLSTSETVEKEGDKEDELPELVNEEALSLFSIGMPGVMTAEEVLNKIDLDHWLLLVHGTFVHMEDLVGWEDAQITDAQSVKGIVGELVAVLGVEVAKKSACVLFD
jgi:arginine-tRNA-protein transferase